MVDKTELLALAERVEGLTGADDNVDGAIYAALKPHMRALPDNLRRFYDPTLTTAQAARDYHIAGATAYAPRYTASLDAAMGLVPEGFDWAVGTFDDSVGKAWAWVGHFECEANGATPALALTAAALRARAEQEPR